MQDRCLAILKAIRRYKIDRVCLVAGIIGILLINICIANQDKDEKNNLVFLINNEAQNSSKKDCYVWFETNTEANLNKYITHSKQWAMIGKPIVTARIFNIENYTIRLIDEGINAIAGFKTSNILGTGSFSNEDSWKQIARVARNLSKLTNGKPVVLENEGSVSLLISKGVTSIDYQKLLNSISAQQWPEIWFWYGPLGQKEPLKTISFNIARAIKNGIPSCRLIEPNSAGFSISSLNKNCQNNLKRTFELDLNPISIVYLGENRKNYWELEDTDKAIQKSVGDTVIIYPGIDNLENYEKVLQSVKTNN